MESSSAIDFTRDVYFRTVRPIDVSICADIEKNSYPPDEMASLSTLHYRQHHASTYFRCALLRGNNQRVSASSTNTTANTGIDIGHSNNVPTGNNQNAGIQEPDDDDDSSKVIGFVCGTRCNDFTKESMYSSHVHNGPILAIHSVVVESSHRQKGIASLMLKDYISFVKQYNDSTENMIEKIVLLSKSHLLGFYVNSGFQVTRPSSITHGKDQWFELELDLGYPTDQTIPCFVIDAFADTAQNGTGNPAAVVLLQHQQMLQRNFLQQSADESNNHSMLSENAISWMQTVANEFNLSETAFVWPVYQIDDTSANDDQHYYIKYFTPTIEVELCGHATLASASVLFQECRRKNPNKQVSELGFVSFHTVGGIVLKTTISSFDVKNGKSTEIKMTFPTSPPVVLVEEDDKTGGLQMLSNALNIDVCSVIFLGITEDRGDLFVELTYDSFINLSTLDAKFAAFLEWNGYNRGVIVSCLAKPTTGAENEANNSLVDFYSRFFGPKAGIDEDPVTGSAHCTLAPYYSKRLDGKLSIVGYQKSRRGGRVRCTLYDDGRQVTLTGTAVNTVQGQHCW